MSFGQPAVGGTDTDPRCPRHPDAVSYVRCQRCVRPGSAQCQRPAAVGFQCVDCVADQAAATPTPRTTCGGTVRDGRPIVTWVLIGLCVVVFLLQVFTSLHRPFVNSYSTYSNKVNSRNDQRASRSR